MNPFTGLGLSDYLKIARDIAILVGVGFILWFVWNAKGNKDEIANLKTDMAVVKQNAAQQTKWQGDITSGLNTAIQKQQELSAYLADPANHKPIIVRVPASSLVPGAAGAAGPPANAGGVSPGHEQAVQLLDVRPMWDSYIAKYGQALIDGQKCYDSWPK